MIELRSDILEPRRTKTNVVSANNATYRELGGGSENRGNGSASELLASGVLLKERGFGAGKKFALAHRLRREADARSGESYCPEDSMRQGDRRHCRQGCSPSARSVLRILVVFEEKKVSASGLRH